MNQNSPIPGYCTEATVTRIIDGDTIEIEVKRKVKIRLLGIDVHEKNTENGKEAILFLEHNVKGEKVLLFIPANKADILMDISSFERILGEIWVDNKNLSSILREEGFEKSETKTKNY